MVKTHASACSQSEEEEEKDKCGVCMCVDEEEEEEEKEEKDIEGTWRGGNIRIEISSGMLFLFSSSSFSSSLCIVSGLVVSIVERERGQPSRCSG
jgi:hypothetical protein